MSIYPVQLFPFLWVGWITGWFLAAGNTKRTVARQPTGSRSSYAIFQWAGALLLAHPFRTTGFFAPILPASQATGWSAVVVALAGLGFTVWARVHLGRNWSAVVTLKDDHTLIRSGPYAITRHPIYTGLLTAIAATALVRGSAADLLALALFVTGITVKLKQEERLMEATFGPAYQQYRREVPMLVPNPLRRRSSR